MQQYREYETPVDKERNREMAKRTGLAMTPEHATTYRRLTARLNYLALDRPDIAYACKEASRMMAEPEEQDWARLERISGYLRAYPRLVHKFDWQLDGSLIAAIDADWAGCRTTRKRTSGGYVRRGAHVVKAWSKTQPVISRATAEAELIACEEGSSEIIGLHSAAKDFGHAETMRLNIDATACYAIIHRRGIGKVRHLEVERLWIQEKALNGTIT